MAALSPRIRALLWTAAVLALVFAGMQFVRPAITNPPVTAEIQASPQVKAVLRKSCYGCHSNETKLAWFDQIVPAYWLVASDVRRARAHLNFSEIGAQPAARQKAVLYEAVNMIQMDAMPLASYRHAHPEAAVSAADIAVLRNYLDSNAGATPAAAAPASPQEIAAGDAQFSGWVGRKQTSQTVQPELNGVAFVPDYKNWRAISSTERFDNGTMREILGNDVAVRAIAEDHINPWPDGTMFAKVAWKQQPGADGSVHTGQFVQVELMIRDGRKYKSTAGWGWGRWLGTGLKPYGKNADLANECITCHLPVRANDHVYTMPIAGQAAAVAR